jgi:hypothetical protein
MVCPRCSASTSGVRCASCGETLLYAPPAASVDAPGLATLGPPGGGAGWLIAAGTLQILLGALWLVIGAFCLVAFDTALIAERLGVTLTSESANIARVAMGTIALCGVVTVVVSSFVIARRQWAWVVSLIFDFLWLVVDLFAFVQRPLAGVFYLFLTSFLLAMLFAGRRALRLAS